MHYNTIVDRNAKLYNVEEKMLEAILISITFSVIAIIITYLSVLYICKELKNVSIYKQGFNQLEWKILFFNLFGSIVFYLCLIITIFSFILCIPVTITFIIDGKSLSNITYNKYYILIMIMLIFEVLSIIGVCWLKIKLHVVFMKNTLSYNMRLLNFNVEILTIITLLLTAINGMVHSKKLAQYIVIFTFAAAFAAIEKLFYNQKTRN